MTWGTAFGGHHGGTRFRGRSWAALALVVLLSAVGLSIPRSAPAMPLPANDSGITGHFDTTVSMGAAMRVSERDERLFSRGSGGKALSFNNDDGNLNYDRGDLVSLSAKVNHELQLNLESPGAELGLFGRVLYFYDHVVADGDNHGYGDRPGRRARRAELPSHGSQPHPRADGLDSRSTTRGWRFGRLRS